MVVSSVVRDVPDAYHRVPTPHILFLLSYRNEDFFSEDKVNGLPSSYSV